MEILTIQSNETKICWEKVKILRKGLDKPKPSAIKMMKKHDGSKCVSAEENAEVFRQHFHKLYEREPVFDPTVIDLLESQPVFDGLIILLLIKKSLKLPNR